MRPINFNLSNRLPGDQSEVMLTNEKCMIKMPMPMTTPSIGQIADEKFFIEGDSIRKL